jgi:hypothetical protein
VGVSTLNEMLKKNQEILAQLINAFLQNKNYPFMDMMTL